ncbi:Hypothetical protein A7982_07122 [Minicystis rosea]|nr:Hypothetical protein A7982_07122 [Minicystis rosea]
MSSSSATSSSSGSTTASSGTGGAGTGGSIGTGGGGMGGMMGTGGGGGAAAFALTSAGFTEGSAIPVKFACAGPNVSPPLAWPAGPGGTQSYAVVLTDKSNNLIHWVIWDIPGSVHALPENVQKTATPSAPAGAKQVKSYDNTTVGYLGPCPPNQHTYEFAVYALDVATLPNVTTASTRTDVFTEIKNHDLASAKLTGTYTP